MNISSTPFIRNDYWPDYNDINELNKRIDETENEISLVNIRLSTDIENVSNNLNSYINNQANTIIANNIIVNNLNANYATGKFANFTNTNTDNAYVENLTVNKPVFDITLNTPHIENTTSLGGNFYNTNLIDPKFSGDASGDFNTVNVDVINANTANISNLFVNTQLEPVTSSAVLGYDSEGRVIPIRATFDVGFPENADYLYTDSHGTAYAGTKDTSIGESNNLITSFAVKNALDDYANTVNEGFNLVNNALNDIDNWQNSLENNIANSFNDVNNGFNDVNNFVNNGFNDVNNTFNDVNNFVNNGFNDVNNTFNDVNNFVNNGFNDVNNNFSEYGPLLNILNTLIPVSFSNATYYNSSSPVNYRNVRAIEFTTPADTTGSNISVGPQNPVYIKFDEATNTLKYTSNALVINETMFRVFGNIMSGVFSNCTSLNQNIIIPNSVTTMGLYYTNNFSIASLGTFQGCTSLNQNILIPNSVTDLASAFRGCTSLNQNILIPNSVYSLLGTFHGCTSLNQNILIPNSVTNLISAFQNCTILNQNILIPNSVTDLASAFRGCTSLNQNILIPNSVTDLALAFWDCTSLNQNILIPNSVTNLALAFQNCTSLNQNILIPNSVDSLAETFRGCTSLNQNILIPNSVTNLALAFQGCTSLNQDIYIYSQNVVYMYETFTNTHVTKVHIPTSVPKVTSNFMYNCLVNGNTGITFPAANIFNDLPVDIEQWPPV